MRLQSKYFGEIEYEQEDIVTFSIGPFGFEEERAFLILPFEGGSLLCFQSVQTPALAFVAMTGFMRNLPSSNRFLQKRCIS